MNLGEDLLVGGVVEVLFVEVLSLFVEVLFEEVLLLFEEDVEVLLDGELSRTSTALASFPVMSSCLAMMSSISES